MSLGNVTASSWLLIGISALLVTTLCFFMWYTTAMSYLKQIMADGPLRQTSSTACQTAPTHPPTIRLPMIPMTHDSTDEDDDDDVEQDQEPYEAPRPQQHVEEPRPQERDIPMFTPIDALLAPRA